MKKTGLSYFYYQIADLAWFVTANIRIMYGSNETIKNEREPVIRNGKCVKNIDEFWIQVGFRDHLDDEDD